VLYSFGTLGNDGIQPESGVISVGGVLYGTTQDGGSGSSGTVFRLTRTKGEVWTETGIFEFDASNGAHPRAGLLLHSGALFGTTAQGGSKSDAGTVFRIAP
jgi:uncharacterized repeat protein (TIGR03803 family)